MKNNETAVEMIECMSFISQKTLQLFPRGVAGGEMGIMVNLLKTDSKKTPGELSKLMNVSTGRVAAALKSLEKKKYIERIPDELDKRRVTVKLTSSGCEFAKKKYSATIKEVECILECLDSSDASEAVRILKKVTEYMKSGKTTADGLTAGEIL